MSIRRFAFWTLAGAGGLFAVAILAAVAAMALRIPFDMEPAKPFLQAVLTRQLGRNVTLSGSITVAPSFSPVVEVQDAAVASPPDFHGAPFVRVGLVRLGFEVLPLLRFKLHINEITARDIRLNLLAKPDGRVNWAFSPSGKASAPASGQVHPLKLSGDSLVVQSLDLRNIQVAVGEGPEAKVYRLDSCTGSGRANNPFRLSMNGSLVAQPFTADVAIGSLAELLKTQRAWMQLDFTVNGNSLKLQGNIQLPVRRAVTEVNATFASERLDSLDELAGVDLPPLRNVSASASVRFSSRRAELKSLDAQVGSSRLKGSAWAEPGDPLRFDVNLDAEILQLDDFRAGNWSALAGSANATAPADQVRAEAGAAPEKRSNLLSEAVLHRLAGNLTVEVGRVLSGKDKLGRGRMRVSVGGGEFALAPLAVELPGGGFAMTAGLGVHHGAANATLRVLVDDFDIGVWARRAKPDTNMGGKLSLDVALRTTGASLRDLMANAGGHFYVAAKPENFRAGIIDLWAVNLFSAIMDEVDEDKSLINCVMAFLQMKDGLMTTRLVAVDTTKMRVLVDGEMDFRKRRFRVRATPRSKRPEFFSLGTPVGASGEFTNFGLDVAAWDVVWTVVKFTASPVAVPMERIFSKNMPADGHDLCRLSMEQAVKALAGEIEK
ncbi:MAG: AsmA family protein [Desulfovibrionaceae bacterium]